MKKIVIVIILFLVDIIHSVDKHKKDQTKKKNETKTTAVC